MKFRRTIFQSKRTGNSAGMEINSRVTKNDGEVNKPIGDIVKSKPSSKVGWGHGAIYDQQLGLTVESLQRGETISLSSCSVIRFSLKEILGQPVGGFRPCAEIRLKG